MFNFDARRLFSITCSHHKFVFVSGVIFDKIQIENVLRLHGVGVLLVYGEIYHCERFKVNFRQVIKVETVGGKVGPCVRFSSICDAWFPLTDARRVADSEKLPSTFHIRRQATKSQIHNPNPCLYSLSHSPLHFLV